MSKRKKILTKDNLEAFMVVLIFVLLFAIQILAIYWQVEEEERKEKSVSQRIEEIEKRLQEIEKNHDKRK